MSSEKIPDFFSRQKAIPDFSSDLLQQSNALVLGIGGLGCTIALDLCRLGVNRIFLLDKDCVEPSNLNRQVLFSKQDLGMHKAPSALHGLQHHNLKTEIVAFHCDALENWGRIVEIARQCSVVFNCIDFGEYFDFAVASLCKSLKIHYLSGSSYGHTAISESFPYSPILPNGGPCWGCNNSPQNLGVLFQLAPSTIQTLQSIAFIPKEEVLFGSQETGSSVLPCSIASHLVVTSWANSFCNYTMPNWANFNLSTFESFSFPVEQNPECIICSSPPIQPPLNLYINSNYVIPLTRSDGLLFPFIPGSIQNQKESFCYQKAIGRLTPLDVGSSNPIALPAPPSCDLIYNLTDEVTVSPSFLQTPLIKSQCGELVAYLSGRRSVIIMSEDKLYRLKGCGNIIYFCRDFDTFPVEETCPNQFEIRGSMFQHTAIRELYMTQLIGECLKPQGFVTGNIPLGMWEYKLESDCQPEAKKYCAFFETFGEKRLSTHLLSGLNALLPSLVCNYSIEDLLKLVPDERKKLVDGKIEIQPTWSAFSDTKGFASIDIFSFSYSLQAPTIPSLLPANKWGIKWEDLCNTLKGHISTSQKCSLLHLLYWNLGMEVGLILRCMHDSRINWGTFFDHNPCEPHCNSHPNNLIVLPPGSPRFLAPVDFDLSFTEDGFFSPYSDLKEFDLDLFNSWISMETIEMGRALGGEAVNTGVKGSESLLEEDLSVLEFALRDTLVLGYLAGVNGRDNIHPITSEHDRTAMHTIIELALIVNDNKTT